MLTKESLANLLIGSALLGEIYSGQQRVDFTLQTKFVCVESM